jgi:hypothetical protein
VDSKPAVAHAFALQNAQQAQVASSRFCVTLTESFQQMFWNGGVLVALMTFENMTLQET